MKAIVDDKIPYIHGQIEQLVDTVTYLPGSEIGREDVRDADILIVRTRTHCNRQLLEGSSVRLVVTATIGYDHLDTDYLDQAGIQWTNCPGCNATSVAQYVRNSLLALQQDGMLPTDLSLLTIGIVGVGHVGSHVKQEAERLGLNILCSDPPKGLTTTLEELAGRCDIITFHTPLTCEGEHATYHLADERFFNLLRRQPLIVNTSRGPVVDNLALVRALDCRQVSHAVVDVWEGEPHPLPALLERACIATPHIAGYSADGKANATRMTLKAVCQHLHQPFQLHIEPPSPPHPYAYGSVTEGPLRLYDPRVDSQRLKAHPEHFEWLRGNYPLRREA